MSPPQAPEDDESSLPYLSHGRDGDRDLPSYDHSEDVPPPLPEKSAEQLRYLHQTGHKDNQTSSRPSTGRNLSSRSGDRTPLRPFTNRNPSSGPSTPMSSDDGDSDSTGDPAKLEVEGDGAETRADVTKDGRIDMIL